MHLLVSGRQARKSTTVLCSQMSEHRWRNGSATWITKIVFSCSSFETLKAVHSHSTIKINRREDKCDSCLMCRQFYAIVDIFTHTQTELHFAGRAHLVRLRAIAKLGWDCLCEAVCLRGQNDTVGNAADSRTTFHSTTRRATIAHIQMDDESSHFVCAVVLPVDFYRSRSVELKKKKKNKANECTRACVPHTNWPTSYFGHVQAAIKTAHGETTNERKQIIIFRRSIKQLRAHTVRPRSRWCC